MTVLSLFFEYLVPVTYIENDFFGIYKHKIFPEFLAKSGMAWDDLLAKQ